MSIAFENIRHFSEVPAENIASGLSFPIETINRYAQAIEFGPTGLMSGRGEILDVAGGAGKKTRELYRNWYTPTLIDINIDAVKKLSDEGYLAYMADILEFGGGMSLPEIVRLESFPMALFNAVFSSVSYKTALKVNDMYMRPESQIFCVDNIAADRGYQELKNIPDWGRERWRGRYKANMSAFPDLDISYRTFLVAKPGELKRELDWCNDPDLLREVWERRNEPVGSHKLAGVYERFASHFDPVAFRDYVRHDLEYKIVEEHIGLTASRDPRGGSSPAYYTVLQKPHKYRFSPAFYGLDPRKVDTHNALKNYNDSRKWYEHAVVYRSILQHMAERGIKSTIIQKRYEKSLQSERRIASLNLDRLDVVS